MVADFDSPWKEALEVYFPAFLAFCFPLIHADINWSRGFEMLDKELQQLTPRSARGRRYVDKLVRVWRSNGREAWVLIHVEVQTQKERGFARRLYQYNTRLSDHFNKTVVSLAVLADDDPTWRPTTHQEELWGWSVRMTFPPCKLLDYADREAELERDKNPFAKIVLAHVKALQTRRDPAGRRDWKVRLMRGLYEQGLKTSDVRQLFRLIDWLLELPPLLEQLVWDEVETIQEERTMPFIPLPERVAIANERLLAIEDGLRAKFGEEGVSLLPEIKALDHIDKYRAVHLALVTAVTLDDVRRAVAEATAPPPSPKKKPTKRKKS
jgi:hypothetical protein